MKHQFFPQLRNFGSLKLPTNRAINDISGYSNSSFSKITAVNSSLKVSTDNVILQKVYSVVECLTFFPALESR